MMTPLVQPFHPKNDTPRQRSDAGYGSSSDVGDSAPTSERGDTAMPDDSAYPKMPNDETPSEKMPVRRGHIDSAGLPQTERNELQVGNAGYGYTDGDNYSPDLVKNV